MRSVVLREVALEVVRFERAAAGEIFRVEIKHHPLTFVVAEIDLLAFVVREREGWGGRSHGRHLVGRAHGIAGQHGGHDERENESVLSHLFLLNLIGNYWPNSCTMRSRI